VHGRQYCLNELRVLLFVTGETLEDDNVTSAAHALGVAQKDFPPSRSRWSARLYTGSSSPCCKPRIRIP
jgi:hypothetical protein